MKYKAIKVGDNIDVICRGDRPVQSHGWAMITLTLVGGNVSDGAQMWVAMHESELANPVRAGQGNYGTFAAGAAQ